METLESTLEKIKELQRDLSSNEVIQKERSHEAYEIKETGQCHGMTTWDYSAGDSHVPRKKVICQPRITKADISKGGLNMVYNYSKFKNARKSAGQALGYHPIRIWIHEHPIATTLIGIIGTAGLIYNLIEKFNR